MYALLGCFLYTKNRIYVWDDDLPGPQPCPMLDKVVLSMHFAFILYPSQTYLLKMPCYLKLVSGWIKYRFE